MGKSFTGRIVYASQKWGECPDNPEIRPIIKLRAALLNFEDASKQLLEACDQVRSPEIELLAAHIKQQMKNSMSYSKQAFQRLCSLGDIVYGRSKLSKVAEERRNYFPARGPSK